MRFRNPVCFIGVWAKAVAGDRRLGRSSLILGGSVGKSGNCERIGSNAWVSVRVLKGESDGCGAVCGLRRERRGGRGGLSDVIQIGCAFGSAGWPWAGTLNSSLTVSTPGLPTPSAVSGDDWWGRMNPDEFR